MFFLLSFAVILSLFKGFNKHFRKSMTNFLFVCILLLLLLAFEIFGIFCIKLSVKRVAYAVCRVFGMPHSQTPTNAMATIQNVNCH